jgi:hypothetical protein
VGPSGFPSFPVAASTTLPFTFFPPSWAYFHRDPSQTGCVRASATRVRLQFSAAARTPGGFQGQTTGYSMSCSRGDCDPSFTEDRTLRIDPHIRARSRYVQTGSRIEPLGAYKGDLLSRPPLLGSTPHRQFPDYRAYTLSRSLSLARSSHRPPSTRCTASASAAWYGLGCAIARRLAARTSLLPSTGHYTRSRTLFRVQSRVSRITLHRPFDS